MLDRVLAYVRAVLAGEVKGDAAVGRYLMDTFGASTDELNRGAFNSSLQVRLFEVFFFWRLDADRGDLGDRTPSWCHTSPTLSARKRKYRRVLLLLPHRRMYLNINNGVLFLPQNGAVWHPPEC